jgi:hypothetical protein
MRSHTLLIKYLRTQATCAAWGYIKLQMFSPVQLRTVDGVEFYLGLLTVSRQAGRNCEFFISFLSDHQLKNIRFAHLFPDRKFAWRRCKIDDNRINPHLDCIRSVHDRNSQVRT